MNFYRPLGAFKECSSCSTDDLDVLNALIGLYVNA